jgi:LacI family transcriptional regulator
VGEERYGYATWALRAYERACERLGLSPAAEVGGSTAEDMAVAARHLLKEHPDITALTALQDQSVIGAVKATRALGLRVPGDLSIVGMVSDPMAEIATPPMTTVRSPADEMGRTGARLLLDRMVRLQAEAEQVLVRPELTIRGSTANPRRAE